MSAPDAPKRHIQSVFALRPQESVIGLTVQTKQVLCTRYLSSVIFFHSVEHYSLSTLENIDRLR